MNQSQSQSQTLVPERFALDQPSVYDSPVVRGFWIVGIITYGLLDVTTTVIGLAIGLSEVNPLLQIFNEMHIVEVAVVGLALKIFPFVAVHLVMCHIDNSDSRVVDVAGYLFPIYVSGLGVWVVGNNTYNILMAISVLYDVNVF